MMMKLQILKKTYIDNKIQEEEPEMDITVLTEAFLKMKKMEVREGNTIDLIKANIRNVLFCGATRSGKTNCFKIMQDPCYCPDNKSIFSETRGTNFKSFSLKDNKDGTVHNFILSLIDSPGAFEEQAHDSEFVPRSNKKIGELIIDCLKNEVTYLNLAVLFLPIGAHVSDKDVKAIDLFTNMFTNLNYSKEKGKEKEKNEKSNDELYDEICVLKK